MKNLRQLPSVIGLRLVSPPYLPSRLIWMALFFSFTDLAVILLGQPAGYWMDRSRAAADIPFVESLIAAGIVAFVVSSLLYLTFLLVALTVLSRSVAVTVWLPINFIHLTHLLRWAALESKLANLSQWNSGLDISLDAISTFILGVILVTGLGSHNSRLHADSKITRWGKPAFFTAWALVMVAAVLVSALSPRGGWAPLYPAHKPGRRASAAVAYDPLQRKIIMFGGISDWLGNSWLYENDTWEWDGSDWTELAPATLPPARAGHMMAYDEKRGIIILFGGEDKSGDYMLFDTWEWDGKDWRQVHPESAPPGRRGGQLFYDPKTEKVFLAGGFYYTFPDKSFTALNDVWEWDGMNWKYVATLPQSLNITSPNVAFDEQTQRITLFNSNQTMAWESGHWNEIGMSTNPPARYGTWLAGEPESGRMLLFSGVENGVQLADTWLLDGNRWEELHPELSPTPRDAYVMFYDSVRQSFILYGGINVYALNDMWEFVLP